ncbi:CCA tRNA nucleotidyltransferase [Hymenobacter nivis]|uniref:CCA tRNA nucleotidyltransferase n=1 Tax=Hymenobacter nivis TaxID=1850093 RepID=A0A502GXK6_9BACT|nr:CCA tRNA nucleotidyltransferase [Hymenobacter nivis]TPG66741.1 CCA tRNA nucleotidyltransferase [Hymenobacter nivis]
MVSNKIDFVYNDIQEGIKSAPGFIQLKQILHQIEDANFYIAGGAIRNLIEKSQEELNDVDVFIHTKDKYDELIKHLVTNLSKIGFLEFGQYGSPRWYPNKEERFYYDIVPFSKFNVGLGTPQTIEETLLQFDFTANAIAFDIFKPDIYNPVDGLNNIQNKVFKAVRFDFPDSIISEKIPLRRLTVLWFRFIHYASKLNYTIEKETLNWLSINSYRLNSLKLFETYFFKPLISEKILKLL